MPGLSASIVYDNDPIKIFSEEELLTRVFVFGFLFLFIRTKDPPPTGKLIDIAGYKLHKEIKGKGTPAVIMIAGSQAYSLDWALIVPEISTITQGCTYHRI